MSQCPKIILYICTKQINFLRHFRTPSLSGYSFSDPQMTPVARLCINSILFMCHFFGYYKVARETGSNCTMGLFWESYRFFYWLLQSCARDWVSGVKLHYGFVLGTLSLLSLAITKCRARKTESVLCQTALWDCFGNVIASFIRYYEVAQETGSVFYQISTMG